MPTTTTRGYPVPLDSDPVCDGAEATRLLGQAVNDKVGIVACGIISVPVAASAAGTVVLTYPAGRFSAAPVVALAPRNASYNASVAGSGGTNVNVTIAVRHIDNTSATTSVDVMWIAVQQ